MKKIILSAVLISLFVPIGAFAADQTVSQPTNGTPQTLSEPISISVPNPVGVESLAGFFFKILNFILGFSYAIIAFFLIWSGFKFVVAQGNEEKLKDAKASFKYTIIGAIFVIGAQVIVEVLKNILASLA